MDSPSNAVERILDRIRNNRIIAIIIVATIAIRGLMGFYKDFRDIIKDFPYPVEKCARKTVLQINIDKPSNGYPVPSRSDVSGTSTIHNDCKYVFILVRSTVTPIWRITDLILVNTDGRWSGQARFDEVPLNTDATIEVRLTDSPTVYSINQCITTPPEKGGRSNIIHVKRIE